MGAGGPKGKAKLKLTKVCPFCHCENETLRTNTLGKLNLLEVSELQGPYFILQLSVRVDRQQVVTGRSPGKGKSMGAPLDNGGTALLGKTSK